MHEYCAPPAFSATIISIGLDAAKSMPDVTVVHDGNFVGFAAPTSLQARQAMEAVSKKAKWNIPSQPSSMELYPYLKKHVSPRRGRFRRSGGGNKGSVEGGLESAKTILHRDFQVAYIQHAPMETRAAVAEWEGGKLTVWTGTQQTLRVQDELARTFRIARDKVRLIVPDTGGGFGGKHTGEVAVEAARIALSSRRPVSLQWTREEEFTWAYFRPAGVIEIAAGLDSKALS